MTPVHMTMVFRSNTYTWTAVFWRTAIVAILLAWINAYAYGPLPKLFLILTGFLLIRELCRLMISLTTASDEAAALSVAIGGAFPGAPMVRPAHLTKLIHKGSLALRGDHDSVLQMTVSLPYRLRGLKQGRTLRLSYDPGDYGLREFDSIMHSLRHITSVAAAIEAIELNESGETKTSSAVTDLGTPSAPELKQSSPIFSSEWHSFIENYKAGSKFAKAYQAAYVEALQSKQS